MKRFFGSLLALSITAIGLAVIASSTHAQSIVEQGQLKPGNNGQLFNNISINCLDVKHKLASVHEKDGLGRVNLGQLYDGISNKLMSRLNSRIVQDKLDGSELIKISAEYETALNNFKSDYQTYEVEMNILIKSDCSGQNMVFYRNLENVQELRADVNNDVIQLNRLASDYSKSFDHFRDMYEKNNKMSDK